MPTEPEENQVDFKKIVTGLALGAAILGVVVYAGYQYTQKYGKKLVLPGGKTYTGETQTDQANPPTAPQLFTAGPEVKWAKFQGKIFSYSFNYPETLLLGVFPNDPSDAVAVQWGNIPPERNILLNVEDISKREKAYVGKPEEFVRNWYRFFSGLKGVKSVDKFTNTEGLTGYKALYINSLDQTPNTDVFFVISNDNNHLIHIANGILDPVIFDRLVDSVGYQSQAPAEEAPAEEAPAE